jgi:hypothetical protein
MARVRLKAGKINQTLVAKGVRNFFAVASLYNGMTM